MQEKQTDDRETQDKATTRQSNHSFSIFHPSLAHSECVCLSTSLAIVRDASLPRDCSGWGEFIEELRVWKGKEGAISTMEGKRRERGRFRHDAERASNPREVEEEPEKKATENESCDRHVETPLMARSWEAFPVYRAPSTATNTHPPHRRPQSAKKKQSPHGIDPPEMKPDQDNPPPKANPTNSDSPSQRRRS